MSENIKREALENIAKERKQRQSPYIWHKGFAFKVFKGDGAEGDAEKLRKEKGGYVHRATRFDSLPPNVVVACWELAASKKGTMAGVLEMLGIASGESPKMRRTAHAAYKTVNAALPPAQAFKGVPVLASSASLEGLDIGELNAQLNS